VPFARPRSARQGQMIERTEERFGLKPERLAADTAYGAAPMLNWLVEEKGIAPHIPVNDKSQRDDGTFSRSDFRYDPASDVYHCPGGRRLRTTGTAHNDKTLLYRASADRIVPIASVAASTSAARLKMVLPLPGLPGKRRPSSEPADDFREFFVCPSQD
jgi:hypothetical protein